MKPHRIKHLRSRSQKALISLVLLMVATIWLLPMLFGFFATFKTQKDVAMFAKARNLLPTTWTLENYQQAWNYGAAPFLSMAKNSLIVALASVLISLFTNSTAAYAYERLDFKGRETLFWTMMFLSMIPGVVSLVTSYYLFKTLRLLNSLFCLFAGSMTNIWNTFLLRNFMTGIPKEMDEAARIDGANDLMIYALIVLPCLYPAMMVTALFTFTAVWNDLLWPIIAISDPKKITITAGIRQVAQTYGTTHYERVLASCWLAMIPTIFMYLIARRFFLQGLQLSSAVKG